MCGGSTPPLSVLVCLRPTSDLALARLAVSAAAPAASAPPPHGHPISQDREYADDSSDEELFNQFCEIGHMPATLTFRIMRPRTVRAMSFQDLAEREVQHKYSRCERERPGEHVQVFQVDFGYDSEGRPTLDEKPSPVDCRCCMGRAPGPLACPDHQFALSECQLRFLWRNWVPDMDPINPVDHGYDDG